MQFSAKAAAFNGTHLRMCIRQRIIVSKSHGLPVHLNTMRPKDTAKAVRRNRSDGSFIIRSTNNGAAVQIYRTMRVTTYSLGPTGRESRRGGTRINQKTLLFLCYIFLSVSHLYMMKAVYVPDADCKEEFEYGIHQLQAHDA